MILLTSTAGQPVYLDPATIYGITDNSHLPEEKRAMSLTVVFCHGDDTDAPWKVKDSALDVARLRVAWERRRTEPGMRGELPLAIRMGLPGEEPGMYWVCYSHTHALKVEQQAKVRWGQFFRAPSRPPGADR